MLSISWAKKSSITLTSVCLFGYDAVGAKDCVGFLADGGGFLNMMSISASTVGILKVTRGSLWTSKNKKVVYTVEVGFVTFKASITPLLLLLASFTFYGRVEGLLFEPLWTKKILASLHYGRISINEYFGLKSSLQLCEHVRNNLMRFNKRCSLKKARVITLYLKAFFWECQV